MIQVKVRRLALKEQDYLAGKKQCNQINNYVPKMNGMLLLKKYDSLGNFEKHTYRVVCLLGISHPSEVRIRSN